MRRVVNTLVLFAIALVWLLVTAKVVAQEPELSGTLMSILDPDTGAETFTVLVGAPTEVSPQTDEVPTAAKEEEPALSFDLSFSYWSEYLDDSGGIINHDRPVGQIDFILSHSSGVYLELWGSTGLNGGGISSDYGDEFDIYLGWSGEVEEFGLDLDIGVAYFDLLPVDTFSGSDVLQPFAMISKEFEIADGQTLTPYGRVEMLFSDDFDNQGECYFHFGVEHSFGLSESLSVTQKVDLNYDPGLYELDATWIGEYAVALEWSVSELVTINPIMIRLATPLTDVEDDRETEFVWGFGATISF